MSDPKAAENYKAAIDLLNKAIARDAQFALAYCLLVDANAKLSLLSDSPSYLTAADDAVHAAMRVAPDAGETHLAQAVIFYRGKHDYDRALEQLELAAQSLPNSVDVALLSAQVERRLGRWTESVRHYFKASGLDPRDFRTRADLSLTLAMIRRYPDALRVVDRAILDFPERADVFRRDKASIAANQGDLQLARETLRQMSTAEANTIFTVARRYNTAMLLHDYDEADRVVAARAELPEREFLAPEAYFFAQVAWARGDKEKARRLSLDAKHELEARLHAHPEHPSAGWWQSDLAEVEATLGHKEEAVQAIEDALKSSKATDPLERPNFLYSRAMVYTLLGEREEALRQLEDLAKTPNGATYGDLRFHPVWESLRGDPRFEKILAEAAKPLF